MISPRNAQCDKINMHLSQMLPNGRAYQAATSGGCEIFLFRSTLLDVLLFYFSQGMSARMENCTPRPWMKFEEETVRFAFAECLPELHKSIEAEADLAEYQRHGSVLF